VRRKPLVKPRYFRIAQLNSERSLFNVQAAAKDRPVRKPQRMKESLDLDLVPPFPTTLLLDWLHERLVELPRVFVLQLNLFVVIPPMRATNVAPTRAIICHNRMIIRDQLLYTIRLVLC
jgi:hypothetical protein